MHPLDAEAWSEHFSDLKPYILEDWPLVEPQELESARNDWDQLLAVLQRASGLSSDEVLERLRRLEIPELGIGTGEDRATREGQASLAQLRLGTGFHENERDRVVSRLDKLNRRLKRFTADGTDLEISVKERETEGQVVTLTAALPGFAPMVATSHEADLRAALADVRQDLWRQIDDAVTKRQQAVR